MPSRQPDLCGKWLGHEPWGRVELHRQLLSETSKADDGVCVWGVAEYMMFLVS